jgi:uncharacterized protein (DUF1330 family)
MVHYLILVTIKEPELFTTYITGHLPGLHNAGGKIVFRSTDNSPIIGAKQYDVVVIQEWPSEEAFNRWWHSDEYRPWAELRERAADMTIVACHNSMPEGKP